jgi:hypothetical protein
MNHQGGPRRKFPHMVDPLMLKEQIYVRNRRGLHVPLATMSYHDMKTAWFAHINRRLRTT